MLEGMLATLRRYPLAVFGSSLLLVAIAAALQLALLWPVVGALARLPDVPADEQDLTAWLDSLQSFPWQWAIVALVLAGMVSFALLTSLTGLLAVVVGQAVLGRPLSFGDAWRRAGPRLPRLLLTVLLVDLAVAAAWLVLALLWLLAAGVSAPAVVLVLLVLLTLAAVPLTVYLAVRLALATPAVMLESDGGTPIGPTRAVRRSWSLVAGGWWRTFGILLLGGVIAGAVNTVLSIPLQAVVGLVPMQLGVGLVVGMLGGILGQAVSLPVSGLVLALVYVDRRMRDEALDVALARAAGVQ